MMEDWIFVSAPHVPGADDLLGVLSNWQLLQQVTGEIEGTQVDETPWHHRGQGGQTVG